MVGLINSNSYIKVITLSGLLLACSLRAYSQACNCPAFSACSPCSGGISSLTLQFNGLITSAIIASDGSGIVFSGLVNPGGTFTFSGSVPSDKFQGPNVVLTVDALPNATISSNCNGTVFVGSVFGSFTVMAALSKSGGAICCSSSTVETAPPVISGCPTSITANTIASACSAVVTWIVPSATDNCTLASFIGDHNSGDSFPMGTTLVTYTATDSYGNTSTCSFNVIVNDNTAPVLTGCPTDITVSLPSSSCSTNVIWTAPAATDNCTLASFTPDHASGSSFPKGTTLVTYTATDNSGNTSTCSFNVIVNDATVPVITGCPTNIMVNLPTSGCSTNVTWTAPAAADNCTLTSFAPDHASGSSFPKGTTLVAYTATDGSGNTSTCSFNVIVNDATVPVITGCPTDITTNASASACSAVVTWTAPTATDNCTIASLVASHTPGSTFSIGTTTVTYSATDQEGNSSTCSFKVVVKNNSSPEIKGCPDDIVANANEDGTIAVTWKEPEGTVQCGNLSVNKSHEPGSTFPVGISPIVYEFIDDYGNSSTCTFNVSVLEHEALFGVAKAVTPDGDGINDVWMLTNIEKYTNTVLVVDRWGNKNYSATGYNNQTVVWNATNTNGTFVPTGTYFYKIEVHAQGKLIHKTGFLEVIQ